MSTAGSTTPGGPPPGFYDDPDGSGRQRWFDGTAWTAHFQSPPAVSAPQAVNVTVQTPAQDRSRKARDKAVYTRQQKGHSLILFLLTDIITLYMRTIYYTISPNHYWHA